MAVNREQVLQSAEKLLAKGKLDQALKEYLRVLEDNPKDISTLNKVGDLYVRMNRPGDSIPYFTRIADFYSRDGFFLKAIAIFKKINKIDPAQLEVYDKLADLYHKQGLVQDARSQYQVLADHYQKNNRVADAIGVYKKMAAIARPLTRSVGQPKHASGEKNPQRQAGPVVASNELDGAAQAVHLPRLRLEPLRGCEHAFHSRPVADEWRGSGKYQRRCDLCQPPAQHPCEEPPSGFQEHGADGNRTHLRFEHQAPQSNAGEPPGAALPRPPCDRNGQQDERPDLPVKQLLLNRRERSRQKN